MIADTQTSGTGDALLDMDHKVHRAVKSHRAKPAVKLLGVISDIGDQPQARLLCGGVIVLGLARTDLRMVTAGVRMLMAHEAATAMKSAVKHRVDRKRPRSAPSRGEEKPQPGQSREKEESSFPSGHSAGAMAIAAAFSAVYPRYRQPALLAAGTVALAQIPRCAHYPTDVGAGLAIGAAADGLVALAWRMARSGVGAAIRRFS
jgi:undecaprenyl-diphosphatase